MNAPISYQIAIDSGLFEWRGDYLRPIPKKGVSELFDKDYRFDYKGYVKPANRKDKPAFLIGDNEYSLQEFAQKLNIDLNNYYKLKKNS